MRHDDRVDSLATGARSGRSADESLKRGHEQAAELFRKAEQDLGEFKRKNGQDIEKNYQRLNDGYRAGNDKHKDERDAQDNRLNNCITINRTDIGYEPR